MKTPVEIKADLIEIMAWLFNLADTHGFEPAGPLGELVEDEIDAINRAELNSLTLEEFEELCG